MSVISKSMQCVKAQFLKFTRWINPRYLENPKLSVSSIRVLVEDEDPIENRTEIYIAKKNDE